MHYNVPELASPWYHTAPNMVMLRKGCIMAFQRTEGSFGLGSAVSLPCGLCSIMQSHDIKSEVHKNYGTCTIQFMEQHFYSLSSLLLNILELSHYQAITLVRLKKTISSKHYRDNKDLVGRYINKKQKTNQKKIKETNK